MNGLVDAIMLVRDEYARQRLIVSMDDWYFWMNRRGEFRKIKDHDVEEMRQLWIQAAWENRVGGKSSVSTKWAIVDEFTCDPTKTCKVGSKTYTRCGLITILTPSVAFHPEKWTLPMEELCDMLRRKKMRQVVPRLTRGYMRGKRNDYTFREIDGGDITPKHLDDICQGKINRKYLAHALADPKNRVLVAVRTPMPCKEPTCYWIKKTRKCVEPSTWNIYRRLVKLTGLATPYNTFRETIMSMTNKRERTAHLCRLLETTQTPLIGGVCVFVETSVHVKIIILCSHRSIGSILLKHIIQRFRDKKIILVNHPLEDVIDFYSNHGFRWHDSENMIYTTSL